MGISECSSETLRRAHAVHPISALQMEHSAFALGIEDEKTGVLKTARELRIPIVAYSPLGRGLLTGKYVRQDLYCGPPLKLILVLQKSHDDLPDDDWRKILPRFSKENFPSMLKITDGIKEIGKRHNATPGQVALAWLLEQGDDIIPIFGTTQVKVRTRQYTVHSLN